MPGVSYYDLLGVTPDATPEQIKTAWRSATDKFQPGSGTNQFRLFNDAAELLLDPAKRAAYDAELSADDDTGEREDDSRGQVPDRAAVVPERTSEPAPVPDSAVIFDGTSTKRVEDRGEAAIASPAPTRDASDERADYASYGSRVGAALIDGLLQAVAALPLYAAAALAVARSLKGSDRLGALVLGFGIVGLLASLGIFLWNVGYRQGRTGQTYGKAVCNITLVRGRDGEPLGAGMSLVRSLLHVVDVVPLYLGFLWPAWDPKRQTFADKLSDSVVVPVAEHGGLSRSPQMPLWVPGILALLAGIALSTGGYLWHANDANDYSQQGGQEASAAAERALPVVLSYNYQHLEADRDKAARFLSGKYKKEYVATFDKLIQSSGSNPGPAEQTKAVVTATIVNIGVVDAEPGVAKVIVFLNQATVKDGGTPKYSLNRLTVSMVKSGNSWLVDNINSY